MKPSNSSGSLWSTSGGGHIPLPKVAPQQRTRLHHIEVQQKQFHIRRPAHTAPSQTINKNVPLFSGQTGDGHQSLRDLAGHPCTCGSMNAGWGETRGSHHSLAGFSLQEGSQRISLCGIGYGNAAPLQVLP